jgi:DNA-binding response OmpR family regulator
MDERILLIDDDRAVHEVVRPYLEREGYRVHSGFSGRDGIALSSARDAALLIVDYMLPDVPGTFVLAEVRRHSRVPIMMLSGQAGTEQRIEALIAGADDYLMKPFSPRELAARAGALLRRAGTPGADQKILTFAEGRLEIDPIRHEVRIDGRACELTLTEYEILAALAVHPGRVYSRAELTYHSRGHDFEGYERTVDAHIKNLRRKLGEGATAPQIVETVRGVGYRLGIPPS